jgi:D-threo-aldose 1-dehydrogenase
VPLAAAAVQFPLGHPAVACVLVGCRSPAEVDEDVALFELDLPAGLWEELQAAG